MTNAKVPATISINDMASNISTGAAQPLLSDGAPGPVRYAQSWWVVFGEDDRYVRVTDRDLVDRLNDQADRLSRARAAVKEAHR